MEDKNKPRHDRVKPGQLTEAVNLALNRDLCHQWIREAARDKLRELVTERVNAALDADQDLESKLDKFVVDVLKERGQRENP